jgi:putative heme transporter
MQWPGKATGSEPVDPRSAAPAPDLPPGMVLAGAWAWRILVIVGVIGLFFFLVAQLSLIVIPLMVAVLLSALLIPISAFLQRHGWPKWLAIVATIFAVLVFLAALVFLVVTEIVDGYPALERQTFEAYGDFKGFLTSGSVHFTPHQLNEFYRTAMQAFQSDSKGLLAGALSFGSSFGHFLTGLLLTVFATIILLVDGAGVWRWCVRLVPRRARAAVDGAGHAGWLTLTSFVKVQIFVAFVDALGIGVIAGILRIPLAIPIAVAVFLGSFIPIVGAVVTGAIAVFVALVYNGPVIALIMLAGVLFIHLLEGHVLQPLVMGNAVRVHPLAVVFAVAGGTLVGGIAGALFAVPIVATVNVMVNFVASGQWRQNPRPHEDDVVPRQPAAQEGVVEDV